jgi:ubiquinone/menaquinone biosynthesis C-methylase UbiE
MSTSNGRVPEEVLAYYAAGGEAGRLLSGAGQLELLRTREILLRYLPPAPAEVLDVGGGAGIHALWLARQGYDVHLVDVVPLHVEQARRASAEQPDFPLASASVGDARTLDRPASSADAVLLLGPLYHLTERSDRVAALREGRRVLRAGGVLFAVGITRFASLLDGLISGYLQDPEFERIVERDLAEGQHRNPENKPSYFTTAYFHHPKELAAEVQEAGLHPEATLGIEGPGWLLQNLSSWWKDDRRREALLRAVRRVETEPSIVGASAHIMVVARKQSKGE